MTRDQMLHDGSYIQSDLGGGEDIVIGVQALKCLVLSASYGNSWEDGGQVDGSRFSVAIEQSFLTTMPKQGDQCMFRGMAYSVASAVPDHDSSRVRIDIETIAGRK